MTDKQNKGDKPRIEDYGSPATDVGGEDTSGVSRPGQQFGEWNDSGTGTDLTREMDEMGPGDAKSGLIKGGQSGKDEVGGPARYGGESGSLSDEKSEKK